MSKSSLQALFLLAIGLLMGACASMGPSAAELAQADYGRPINQQSAEEIASAYFKQRIESPESARFEFSRVQPDWMQDPLLTEGKTIYGYGMTVKMNRKNTLGRYTGDVAYKLMFRDGKLQHIVLQPRLSNDVTYMGKIY